MADGSLGERIIDIDLAVTGARAIRPATQTVKVSKILISGVAGAASSAIILRKEVATTGPIVFYFQPVFSVNFAVEFVTEDEEFLCAGLFLDSIVTGYTSGHMLIYTR